MLVLMQIIMQFGSGPAKTKEFDAKMNVHLGTLGNTSRLLSITEQPVFISVLYRFS